MISFQIQYNVLLVKFRLLWYSVRVLPLLILCIPLVSCASKPFQPINATETYLLSTLSYFDFQNPRQSVVIENEFFSEALSLVPGVMLHSGYFPSQGELLVAHMFYTSRASDKTLVLIHGFRGGAQYSHFLYLMQQFVMRDYRVVVLNLPGHEFSGGIRGGIASFEHYGDMVKDFINYVPPLFSGENSFVGHSTGAVALMIALQDEAFRPYADRAVFLSPYSRLRGENVLTFLSHFADAVGKDDELFAIITVSREFMPRYREWRKQAQKYPPIDDVPILVLFAENDRVVHVEQSERYHSEKFPQATLFTYKNQNHTFTNSGYREVREHVMQFLLD